MIPTAAAPRRTFYIERKGDEYKIVTVWEAGAVLASEDLVAGFNRVLVTEPDERIIAEQTIGILPGGELVGDPAAVASAYDAAERIVTGGVLDDAVRDAIRRDAIHREDRGRRD